MGLSYNTINKYKKIYINYKEKEEKDKSLNKYEKKLIKRKILDETFKTVINVYKLLKKNIDINKKKI